MSAFNNRIEQGLHVLFRDERSKKQDVPASKLLGAAICIGSGGAPYDEVRNPFVTSAREFIDFKMGWQLAATNRKALTKMGAIV
jgi:hypothetical protein